MAERKSFVGDRDAAFEYLNLGRNMLTQLVQSMRLNNLQVLSRSLNLPNGVTITVSSTFGQNDIRIEASPFANDQIMADIEAIADVAENQNMFGQLQDIVTVSGTIKLTLTTPVPPPPSPPPVVTPPSPPPVVTPPSTGGSGGGDSGGGGTPTSSEIDVTIRDSIVFSSSIRVTLITATYPTYTPPPVPPQVFIAGQTSSGLAAFVWDDVNGYKPLNTGSTTLSPRRNSMIQGLSPNGLVLCGSLDIYDSSPNPAYTIPFGGTGTVPPIGWVPLAAKWQTRDDVAQLARYIAGGTTAYGGIANTVDNTGTIVQGQMYGPQTGGFTWDGQNNHAVTAIKTAPAAGTTTSPNGRLKVSGQKYQIDGGPWINWGPNSTILPSGARQAPSDATPHCCVHVPYNSPAMPVLTPTYTTTVLVFSA